jgi:scyllo-inositol 2-dehydrogenase (NADP+)
MKPIINVGLAGFGTSGEFFHAPFIANHPGFRLAKVQERHHEKSRKKYPYVEVVRSYEEIIEDKDIDLIIITTPNYLHYQMAKQALLAGKHVVVEKPFTATSAEALELAQLASEQGQILTVYHNRRWDGDFMTVKQVIEQDLLGELVDYEAHFDRYRPDLKMSGGNMLNWKENQGPGNGYLYDLGSHLIDQTLHLFGLPDAVYANIRTLRQGSEVPDSFEIQLNYSKLKATLKSSTLVREPGPRYLLHGTIGSFIKYGIDPQEEALRKGLQPGSAGWGQETESDWGVLHTELNGMEFKGRIATQAGNYDAFYQRLWEAIIDNIPPAVTPQEGAHTIRIIELAMESNLHQRTVPFEI